MTETSGNLALKKETSSKFALPAIRTRFSSAGSARCIVVLRQERRFNAINLHLYHYAGNNPVKYVDPDGKDDLYYDETGNYIKTVEAKTTNVYCSKTTTDSTGTTTTTNTLLGSQSMFNDYTAAILGESSGNAKESRAIADVIENRSTYTGRSIQSIVSDTGIYGYNTSTLTTTTNSRTSNENTNLVTARCAVIGALTSNTDTSGGAYFWEGLTFITPTSKNYNPNNWFVQQGWGKTSGTVSGVIKYLETTTIGGTVFMNNNPEYRRASYP